MNARQRYQAKWNNANTETRRNASRNGKTWTPEDLAVAARSDLTNFEAAAILKRTAAAVAHARKRIAAGVADKPGQKRLQPRTREINARENIRRTERRHTDEIYNATQAARKRDLQKESLEHAPRRGLPWTGPELEIADRRDLTAAEIAAMTGRTLHAVHFVRAKLRAGIPREVLLAGVRRA